jgi:serine/threonine protein kinase
MGRQTLAFWNTRVNKAKGDMKCTECSHSVSPGELYCSRCGAELSKKYSGFFDRTQTLSFVFRRLKQGDILAQRYEVIEELGSGAMGRIYKVLDNKIGEKMAMKILNPEITSDETTVLRFKNELRLARKITHKNVCRMFDIGDEKGMIFITMEYVSGEDLKRTLMRIGQLSPGKAIIIAKQICAGLTAAHRMGVIHRDLKPQNIMLDQEGNIRIMDFGIARSTQAKGLTATGVIIGTPEYISPEQLDELELDQRSDIYSLGVIFYEMLTGIVPFEGKTPLSVVLKHKTQIPKDPLEINPQIPHNLKKIVLKCLAKDREKRYQSAREFSEALSQIEADLPLTRRILPQKKYRTFEKIAHTFKMRHLRLILILVLLSGTLLGLREVFTRSGAFFPEWDSSSIAVFRLVELTEIPMHESLCIGLTNAILTQLTKTEKLKVVFTDSILYKKDLQELKRLGRKYGAAYVLTGEVQQKQDRFRVTVQLIAVQDGSYFWAEVYDRNSSEILELQSDIAEKVAEAIEQKFSPHI